jgi:hypothetical protein
VIWVATAAAVAQGGARSCQAFCGYHNDVAGRIFYAVMPYPYPGFGGWTDGLSTIDALTSTSSHELCEAITDPVPGRGWYDDANSRARDPGLGRADAERSLRAWTETGRARRSLAYGR